VRVNLIGKEGLAERELLELGNIRPPSPRPGLPPPYPPEYLEDLQLPQPMGFAPDPARRVLR